MFWKNLAYIPMLLAQTTSCLLIFSMLLRIKVSCFTNSIKLVVQWQVTGLILPPVWLSRKDGENSSQLQQEPSYSL